METVAYSDAAPGTVLGKDFRHRPHALKGGPAVGIGEYLAGRNALLDEVIPPDASLGEDPVSSSGTGGQDERGQVLLFEVEGVVEPGSEDGRGLTGVLCCAEDDNGIGA
jgi:hypothetical protein